NATAQKDNKSETRDNESDRSTRRGVRAPMVGQVLCLLTNNHLPHPFGNALPSASNDHFRYPLFHFRYPFMPLSKSLSLPANARATDESRRCRHLCYPKLGRASLGVEIVAVERRQLLAQSRHLGQVVDHDVRLIRMVDRVLLVI